MKSLPVLAESTRRGASLFEPLKGAERLAGGEARNEQNHRIASKRIQRSDRSARSIQPIRLPFTTGIFHHIPQGRAPTSQDTLLGMFASDDDLPD